MGRGLVWNFDFKIVVWQAHRREVMCESVDQIYLCFGSLLKENLLPSLHKVGLEQLPLFSKRSRWDGLHTSRSRGAVQLAQEAAGRERPRHKETVS